MGAGCTGFVEYGKGKGTDWMKLAVLLDGFCDPAGDLPDLNITGMQTDSRRIEEGNLFVALSGHRVDGHTFALKARDAGAAAVLAQDADRIDSGIGIPVIPFPEVADLLGPVASRFFGDPSSRMTVVGITGTNGKTSTTYFCRAALEGAGMRAGLIGTIENVIGETRENSVNTTPDALELQRLFYRMLQAGCDAVVMEVSSHALSLGRVLGTSFDVGLFTNITEDHLDFHGSMDAYLEAKLLFLEYLKKGAGGSSVLVNTDIEYRDRVMEAVRASGIPCRTFGQGEADYCVENASAKLQGTSYTLRRGGISVDVDLAARGFFAVPNSAGALAAAEMAGADLEKAAVSVAGVSIPGRFELVPGSGDFLVVVDYAHTDDALKNLIDSARRLNPSRVLTVFGCGGDRDRKKRPLMAKAAEAGSDLLFITSDNPRTEDPDAIIRDILEGIRNLDIHRVVPDRAQAIEAAIREAREGDIVLIAGKGHEDYQIFRDRTIHFSDRETAAAVLECL